MDSLDDYIKATEEEKERILSQVLETVKEDGGKFYVTYKSLIQIPTGHFMSLCYTEERWLILDKIQQTFENKAKKNKKPDSTNQS